MPRRNRRSPSRSPSSLSSLSPIRRGSPPPPLRRRRFRRRAGPATGSRSEARDALTDAISAQLRASTGGRRRSPSSPLRRRRSPTPPPFFFSLGEPESPLSRSPVRGLRSGSYERTRYDSPARHTSRYLDDDDDYLSQLSPLGRRGDYSPPPEAWRYSPLWRNSPGAVGAYNRTTADLSAAFDHAPSLGSGGIGGGATTALFDPFTAAGSPAYPPPTVYGGAAMGDVVGDYDDVFFGGGGGAGGPPTAPPGGGGGERQRRRRSRSRSPRFGRYAPY